MSKTDITTRVMDEIKNQDVTMRPRWYFTFLTILGVLTVTMLGLAAAYLVDIAILAIRIELSSRPMYGARLRLTDLITGFPWWIVALAALSIAALIWLLRRSGVMHRHSIGWLIALVVTASLILGIMFSYTPLGNGSHTGGAGYGRGGQNQTK